VSEARGRSKKGVASRREGKTRVKKGDREGMRARLTGSRTGTFLATAREGVARNKSRPRSLQKGLREKEEKHPVTCPRSEPSSRHPTGPVAIARGGLGEAVRLRTDYTPGDGEGNDSRKEGRGTSLRYPQSSESNGSE